MMQEVRDSVFRTASIICNDEQHMVITAIAANWRGKPHTYFVLDKTMGKWWHFAAKEDTSTMQMFDLWLVVQEKRDTKPNFANSPTGEFGFHQRDGHGHFFWNATPDTEVLAIEGPRLFYRQGCQLMTADIDNNKIVNERVLFKSEDAKTQKILEQVHWLFPMNTPKQP
jgi:hypothetical protein